jgi:hypothetical protein
MPSPPSEGPARPQLTVTIGRGFWRNMFKWVFASLLVLALMALLVAISLAHLTAEGPAKRVLRRSVASLTEIDTLLDQGYEELRASAQEDEEASLQLADFPVQVDFSSEEVLSHSRPEFRQLLLNRSADKLYDEGMSAFREEDVDLGEEDISFFSSQGAARDSLDFLRDNVHDSLRIAVACLAGLSTLFAAGLVLLARGFGRLASLGAATTAAAIPLLTLGLALRFALRLTSEGDNEYVVGEFLEIAQEVAWIPIRNSIPLTGMGVAFLVVGVGLALWADRRAPRSRWAAEGAPPR